MNITATEGPPKNLEKAGWERNRREQEGKLFFLTESFSFACLNAPGVWLISPPAAIRYIEKKILLTCQCSNFRVVFNIFSLSSHAILKANEFFIGNSFFS